MQSWDEIRTAYVVAKIGTVSGAAAELGVHHATVIRHVDALENRLGVKLFQRHSRGYTATEAGHEVLNVVAVADDQFRLLQARLQGQQQDVGGELIVTAVPGSATLVSVTATRFQARYPDVTVRMLFEVSLAKLEFGEAHVAVRGGTSPKEPDNIGQRLFTYPIHLCAARSYVDAHGLPGDLTEFAGHRFVGQDQPGQGAPFHRWLHANVPADCIRTRSNDIQAQEIAITSGSGIGFVGSDTFKGHPGLVEVMAPLPEWQVELWAVTHVDMHRTTKVQEYLAMLKEVAGEWQSS